MKHHRSVEFLVLVAGIAVTDGGQVLHAAEMSAMLGQEQMYAAAMGEAHARAAQGYLGIDMRDVSEDQLGALGLVLNAVVGFAGLPVTLADDPLTAVVMGAGKVLDELTLLRDVTVD